MHSLEAKIPSYSFILQHLQKTTGAKKALIITNIVAEPVFKNVLEFVHDNILNESVSFDCVTFNDVMQTSYIFPEKNYLYVIILYNVSSVVYESKSNQDDVLTTITNTLKLVITGVNNFFENIPVFLLEPEDRNNNVYMNYISQIKKVYHDFLENGVNINIVQINEAMLWAGINHMYNPKYEYMINAPYSLTGMYSIARQLCISIIELLGSYKKCIILDCDNVLWGNILDEVGQDGIDLDTNYPGNIYLAFQQNLLKLYESGVLLALCSKNDEKDIFEVIENHPYMILKKEHFISYRINFSNKASNIKEICNEIGIFEDSVVFIDDSINEIDLVDKSLPGIFALWAEHSKIYELPHWIENCCYFRRKGLTEDDLRRNERYHQERKRRLECEKYISYEDYMRSLNVTIECKRIDEQSATRAAQLTQRTNRMNLSCRRYSTNDILSMISSSDYWLRCIYLSDKLGDLGCVCAIIIKTKSDACCIEGFYVSCRAIGRNIEYEALRNFMSEILVSHPNLSIMIKENNKNSEFIEWVKNFFTNNNVQYEVIAPDLDK